MLSLKSQLSNLVKRADLDMKNQETQTFSIATLNLFNYLAPPNAYYDFQNIYSLEQWQKKQTWLLDYFKDYACDIVGFQEVFSPDSLKQLCMQAGYQYFCVLDKPRGEDDFIYSQPVLALASKYPILESQLVTPDEAMVQALGLATGFQFSRQPLRVTIDIPQMGPCDCYVVHFKSKRPYVEGETKTSTERTQVCELMVQSAIGRWGASIRRGSEAALLHHQMVKRRQVSGLPMVLMGDFNDSLESDVLSALTYSAYQLAQDARALLAHYSLKDSFALYQSGEHCPKDIARLPTHYYGSEGKVLDYILLSNEFDAAHGQSMAEVCDYRIHDDHLLRPNYDHDSHSTDHAPVMITLSLRV